MLEELDASLTRLFAEAGVGNVTIDHREFPDEHWAVVHVPVSLLVASQAVVPEAESLVREVFLPPTEAIVVVRPLAPSEALHEHEDSGQLARPAVDQLIQLLEARSRTSDALPSLRYVEDPRASLSVVSVQRHHIVYGRRGVGKTALLLEAKRIAEDAGHATVWINAQTLRRLDADQAFLTLAERLARAVGVRGGASMGSSFASLTEIANQIRMHLASGDESSRFVSSLIATLNGALRGVLREDLMRAYVFVDDFYLLDIAVQPQILDRLHALTRDTNAWIKLASIERLTRLFEPSSRIGLEIPHDATTIDLDVTLEDPAAAQAFLERVLLDYTTAAGISTPRSIVKQDALSRLVLASGGVPRDYLNLLAASIVGARKNRALAREVGKEDVARAASDAARTKRRDLEQDVGDKAARELGGVLDALASGVKEAGFTYFLVRVDEPTGTNFERLGRLVDLRFCHLVQSSLSDQHRPGVRYEAYVLALSEFAGVRLQRGLQVLDLSSGTWTLKRTGAQGSSERLDGTKFRDRLRRAPVVDAGDGEIGVVVTR
jgi:hypothetical protein